MRKMISQHSGCVLSCALALMVFICNSQAQTTTFTYQGSLIIGGSVANGSYDLQFKLYDQLSGGSLQGSPNTVTVSSVVVTNGVFTVDLDFGVSGFPGAARYLEISVRPTSSGSFTTLSPRQQLTSTPYAIRSLNSTNADTATTTTNFTGSLSGDVAGTQSATVVSKVGGVTANNVASGATLANNATNLNTADAIVRRDTTGSFSAEIITATGFSGSGASITNLNASNVSSGTLPDARLSSSVARLNTVQTFTANQTIAANLFQSGSLVQFTPTNGFVAGGDAATGSIPATGAGVRMMWYPGKYAFRAGQASATEWDDANVGYGSVAFGDTTKASNFNSVAMGFGTTSSGISSVAMGNSITASGNYAIGIGSQSTAGGNNSVALGESNQASGNNSVALGRFALTNSKSGSFVFNDVANNNTLAATADNQFNVRATGGLRFFASSDTSDTTKPGVFISGTTGNTQINGNLTVSGLFSGSGSSLTNLNASNITSGVLAIANGGTGSSTQNFVDLLSNQTSIGGNKTFTDTVTASTFSGSGSNLTGLDAGNISSGTLTDARLSSNVALENAANTFTANQTVNANLIQSGTLVQLTPTNGLVAGGTFGSGSIPATGAGGRMMWYPGKAAFRAGYVGNTQWDDANVGNYSIAVGSNTIASNQFSFAGGDSSTASGNTSFSYGFNSTASGSYAVALGANTTAACVSCVALGTNAEANHNYSFVWGGGFSPVTSFAVNSVAWLATGGVRFYTNTAQTAGVSVAAGGGSWSSISDRNLKENFQAVNPRDILRGVLRLPISTWNYRAQDAEVRHIGPMAQDFFAAFQVGEDDKHIATIDPDGVVLAAIQGLHEELKDRDAKLEQQQQELGQLKQQLKQQQAVIDGMRKLLCAQNPQAEVCQKP